MQAETEIGLIHRIPTGVSGSNEADDIMITDAALQKILEVKAENTIEDMFKLRIGTRSGGCSGMNYLLGFDGEIYDNDKIFTVGNLDIVIDSKSIFYLMGVTLEYVETEQGSGFVFNNPNNVKTCGCGGH